jgi:recombinational DNA repair protein RecR
MINGMIETAIETVRMLQMCTYLKHKAHVNGCMEHERDWATVLLSTLPRTIQAEDRTVNSHVEAVLIQMQL